MKKLEKKVILQLTETNATRNEWFNIQHQLMLSETEIWQSLEQTTKHYRVISCDLIKTGSAKYASKSEY